MSDVFHIKGGTILQGEIAVAGAKNHALKMFPASILSEEPCEFTNVPGILDIQMMSEIIRELGGEVQQDGSHYKISTKGITSAEMPEDLVTKMRASFLFVIPLLHRFGEVVFPHPGGDAIGRRPIDMVIDFLTQMGAEIEMKPEAYHIKAKRLKGTEFFFKWITHTGTEAMIMAAVLAEGTSVLKNCAMEPEVVALADYLNSVGAKISGAGTSTVTIEGVEKLGGGTCEIIPDRLEAGTFAILGALCGNPVTVTKMRPDHLDALWKYFDLLGVRYELGESSVTVYKTEHLQGLEVKTHEYPGFVTDLQAPMTTLLTQAEGMSRVHETIYDGRLFFVDKLNSMGADIIMSDPHRVIIQGPSKLYGKKISSPDVRAGMTLVLAALIAKGDSIIENVYHIDRGYEKIEERLAALGAQIERR